MAEVQYIFQTGTPETWFIIPCLRSYPYGVSVSLAPSSVECQRILFKDSAFKCSISHLYTLVSHILFEKNYSLVSNQFSVISSLSHKLSLRRQLSYHFHTAAASFGFSSMDVLKDLKQAITLSGFSGHMSASGVTKPISCSWQAVGSLN